MQWTVPPNLSTAAIATAPIYSSYTFPWSICCQNLWRTWQDFQTERAGAAILLLNFNNVLAAVSKPFYLPIYNPISCVMHLLFFALLDSRALQLKLLVYGIMCSPHSLPLHPHLPVLLPYPTAPVPPSPELSVCSFYLFFSCASTLQMLPCFFNLCLLQVPHFPTKTQWNFCWVFRVLLDFCLPQSHICQWVLPNCPALLWHCTVSSMTKLVCDSPQISRGEEVPVKGAGIFLDHSRKLQGMKKPWEWRATFDNLLGILL